LPFKFNLRRYTAVGRTGAEARGSAEEAEATAARETRVRLLGSGIPPTAEKEKAAAAEAAVARVGWTAGPPRRGAGPREGRREALREVGGPGAR
jgi:hypothetical protein